MNNETSKLLSKVKELTKNEISLDNLSTLLDLNISSTMGLIYNLKSQGLNIVIVNKDNGIFLLNQGERKYTNDYNYSFSTGDDNCIKFLVISDTRLGSIFSQKSILNELYLHAYNNGIRNVIHVGNITEGLYKMSSNMIDTLISKDTISQAKYVIDNYPYIEGMHTYFITGKKDQTHLRENKVDIGNQISNARKDMIYIGNCRCTVFIDNCKMLLLNRKSSKTYTQSYRPQKLIDAMRSEDKPNILLYGGLLQCESFPYRDVEVLSIPSVCATTWEMEEKSYSNTIGGIEVTITTDKNGNFKKIVALNDIYYNTIANDYQKAKTLRRIR